MFEYKDMLFSPYQTEVLEQRDGPASCDKAATTFNRYVVCDSEFYQPPGHRPRPHVIAGLTVDNPANTVQAWTWVPGDEAPSALLVDPGTLWVCFYAPAEMSCFLAAGWPLPLHVLDLYAEFRVLTNRAGHLRASGLLRALDHFGVPHIDLAEKRAMQQYAGTTHDVFGEKAEALRQYCTEDVAATHLLYKAMRPLICLPQALVRGAYLQSVAQMEWHGVPMDTAGLSRLRKHRAALGRLLIKNMSPVPGLYRDGHFYADSFATWVAEQGIPWPMLDSGQPSLAMETFRKFAGKYPGVAEVARLRDALAKLRDEAIVVGPDGRNRCMLSPLRSCTGRNQPSNSKFIFGQPKWMRGYIKPAEGRAIAYLDWAQQEFGIAAALSGDRNMRELYEADDPYMCFARESGYVSKSFATTDPDYVKMRARAKACVLGAQFGIGARKLSEDLSITEAEAQTLLAAHRKTYRVYWKWLDRIVMTHRARHRLRTRLGWPLLTDEHSHYGTVINFMVQGTGAEMLRLACAHLTRAGIAVCAPVHDAIVIEGSLENIEEQVAKAQRIMGDVSEILLGTLRLTSDAQIVRYPERYCEPGYEHAWGMVQDGLAEIEAAPTETQSRLWEG